MAKEATEAPAVPAPAVPPEEAPEAAPEVTVAAVAVAVVEPPEMPQEWAMECYGHLNGPALIHGILRHRKLRKPFIIIQFYSVLLQNRSADGPFRACIFA